MTSDDQLRDALRAEASSVEPGAEGYTQIKERIARRRRVRIWQRSALAAVAAMSVVAVAVVVFTGDDGKSAVHVTDNTPTPTESAEPSLTPSTSPSPVVVPADEPVAAVWPFTSRQEIDAWTPTQYPALTEARTAALGFMNDVLGKHDFSVSAPRDIEPSVAEVDVTRVNGNRTVTVSTVTLRNMGTAGPWVVVVAISDHVAITDPKGNDPLHSSPTAMRGSVDGVDESVVVQVRQAHIATQPLGEGHFPGGQAAGWAGSVTWNHTGNDLRGAVIAFTGSFLDGQPVSLAAVPVQLGFAVDPMPATYPTMPETFVAVHENRLALYRTSDGAFQRYLTEEQPGGGVAVPVIAPDGTTVYFLRGQGTCATGLHAVSTTNQTERSVVEASGNSVIDVDLTLSGDGRKIAYVRTSCADQAQTVVVRDLSSGKEHHWSPTASPPEAGSITKLALNEDGSKLYYLHNPCCGDDDPNLRVLDTTGPYSVLEDDSKTWAFARTSGCHLDGIAVSPAYSDVLATCLKSDNALEVRAFRANGSHQTLFSLPDAGGSWGLSAHATGNAVMLHGSDGDSGEVMYVWAPGRRPRRVDAERVSQAAW